MNIFNKLQNLFIKKSAGVQGLIFQNVALNGSPVNYTLNYYQSWLGVAINRRASALSQITPYAAKKTIRKNENSTELYDEILPNEHWLNKLIQSPNPYYNYSWSDIIKLISYWLDCNGNAYIWLNTNNSKYPVQIYVLPSNAIQYEIDRKSTFPRINRYSVNIAGNLLSFPAEEIVHIKTLAITNDTATSLYQGVPILLNSALDSIEIDKQTKEFLKRKFYTDFIEPVYLSGQDINATEIERLKNQLAQKTISHQIMAALPSGLEFKGLPAASALPTELIKQEIAKDKNVILISAAFGIPYGILDTSSQQNKSNAAEQYAAFRQDTIDPQMQFIASAFTIALERFEENIIFKTDPYLYRDEILELEKRKFWLMNGVISRNDIRKEEGLELIPDGDVYFIPNGITLENQIGLDLAPALFESERRQKFFNVDYKSLPESFKVLRYKQLDNIVKKYRAQFAKYTLKTFNKIRNEVIANIVKAGKKRLKKEEPKLVISDVFDVNFYIEEMLKDFSIAERGLARAIISDIAQRFNGEVPRSDFEELMGRLSKISSNKISDSINNVHKDLKETVQTIIEENPFLTREELTEILIEKTNDKFDTNYNIARIKNIAATTATFVTAQSQKKACESLDLNYVWFSQRDDKVRHTHRQVDGEFPDEKGLFKVGDDIMDAPANGSIAEENCYCRCYLFAQKKP